MSDDFFLQAIIDAKKKCNRIHRDISMDNIILVRKEKGRDRKGILVDWELSTELGSDGRVVDKDRFTCLFCIMIAFLSSFLKQYVPGYSVSPRWLTTGLTPGG